MLRNKRKLRPYILIMLILLSAGVLVFLQIRGFKIKEEGTESQVEYYPLVALSLDKEGSKTQYEYNQSLPLSYTFSHLPYQVDIYQSAYSQVGEGVASKISDSAYLYIGEYDMTKTEGLTKIMEEFPTVISNTYNRNGSYITPKASNSGYIKGLNADNTFAVFTMANKGMEAKDSYICVLDIKDEERQKGIVIAGLTDGQSNSSKDYVKELVETVAVTLRENYAFVEKENTDTKEDSHDNLVAQGVQIDINKPSADIEDESEESSALEESKESDATKESSEQETKEPSSEKPSQESSSKESVEEPSKQEEPSQESQPEPQPEPEPEPQPEPAPQPEPEPQPEPAPQPEPQPQPTPAPPANDPNDVSIKSFEAPLTDIGMYITVTTGRYCADTVVTLQTPSGGSMIGSSDGCGNYTFSLTAEAGTYTIITSHFSQVGTVYIDVHCS